jgi:hypothetical protein
VASLRPTLAGDREAILGAVDSDAPLARLLLPCYSAAVSFVVTYAQCREDVLEADSLGDEEECVLRDHLLAVHPKTLQPETHSVLLRHFVVTERPPPAA